MYTTFKLWMGNRMAQKVLIDEQMGRLQQWNVRVQLQIYKYVATVTPIWPFKKQQKSDARHLCVRINYSHMW
jgi:hypothetical protein